MLAICGWCLVRIQRLVLKKSPGVWAPALPGASQLHRMVTGPTAQPHVLAMETGPYDVCLKRVSRGPAELVH